MTISLQTSPRHRSPEIIDTKLGYCNITQGQVPLIRTFHGWRCDCPLRLNNCNDEIDTVGQILRRQSK